MNREDKEAKILEEKSNSPANLSVIVPVYNHPEAPGTLLGRLLPVLRDSSEAVLDWRILFVDDGSSKKNSTTVKDALRDAVARDNRVGWVSLRRNRGQQTAVFCGLREILKASPAEENHFIITMDDDLKHPPECIPQLLEKIRRGKDLVYAIPKKNASRKSIYQSLGRYLRDLFFRSALGVPAGIKVGSFRIFTSELGARIVSEKVPFIYISALAFRHSPRAGQLEYSLNCSHRNELTRYTPLKRTLVLLRLLLYYSPLLGALVSRLYRAGMNREKQGRCGTKARGGWADHGRIRLHILGAGFCQVSAIKRARELGVTTIVSDMKPDAPGFAFADEVSLASTFDPDGVIEDARRFGSTAFLTTGTDQPVLTAALAAEKLGIPYFLDPHRARLVTNKREMKQAFTNLGVPSSPFLIIHETATLETLASLTPPYVVKPLDSQGQRGVYRLETAWEVIRALPKVLSYSREEEALVEEYYPAGEVTVSGWVEKGEYLHLTMTDRVTRDNLPHIGVCVAHHYPSRFHKKEEEVIEITKRIVRGFGISRGPLYIQYLIGEAGVRVNEAACRLGGAYEDEFIPFITGVDILDIMVRMSCGLEYPLPDQQAIFRHRRKRYVSLQMFFCRSGTLHSGQGMEKALRLPGILGGRFLLSSGTEIGNRENSTQRAGYFIAAGSSPEEVNRRTMQAFRCLTMKTPKGKELLTSSPVLLTSDSAKYMGADLQDLGL